MGLFVLLGLVVLFSGCLHEANAQCTGNFSVNFGTPEWSMLPAGPKTQCTSVTGSIVYYNCSNPLPLGCVIPEQLASVKTVVGDVQFVGNFGAMQPPKNVLTKITGSLTLALNTFVGLATFNSLQEVGDFTLLGPVVSLAGLSKLTTARRIVIYGTSITNFMGLESLTGVSDVLAIQNNPSLSSLHGLEGLKTTKAIVIGQNDALLDLSGLDKLQTIEYFLLSNNAALNSTKGAKSLKTVTMGLALDNLPKLTAIEGFEALTDAMMLGLSNLPKLVDILGFQSLKTVNQLAIIDLPSLVNLSGFPKLTTLDIVSLGKLPKLESVMLDVERAGILSISELPKLMSIHLHHLKIVDMLFLNKLPKVDHIMAPMLTIVNNTLILGELNSLVSLEGFGALETVGNAISIFNNKKLKNLKGLTNLTHIGLGVAIGGPKQKSLSSIVMGQGDLGRPFVMLANVKATKLKPKATIAYLKTICPIDSKVTIKGCAPPMGSSLASSRNDSPTSHLDVFAPIQATIQEMVSSAPH